jgi:hypothetical protein
MIPAPKGAYWGTNEATRHFTSQGRLGGSTTADASAVSAAGTGCGQPPILMVLDELVAYLEVLASTHPTAVHCILRGEGKPIATVVGGGRAGQVGPIGGVRSLPHAVCRGELKNGYR